MAVNIALAAQQYPQAVALRDGERAFSWSELNELVNRAANLLIGQALGDDDRLAVFAGNSAEALISYLGALHAGVSAVLVNSQLLADEVAYILEKSSAKLLWAGPEQAEVGCRAALQVPNVEVAGWGAGPLPVSMKSLDALLGNASPEEPTTELLRAQPDLLFTSGTTGRPRAVRRPFRMPETVAAYLEQLRGNRFADLGPHLAVGPIYHTGPHNAVFVLAAGTPVVILPRFSATAALEAIATHDIASSVMVPTHFVRLLELPTEVRESYDVTSLKVIAHTGASCPIEVKRAMIDWVGPILSESYGASEVGTTCAITSEEWLAHPGSVGRPTGAFDVRVIDEHGDIAVQGTPGRLCFRERTGRRLEYYRDPEASAAAYVDDEFFTLGEVGYVDSEGYVYVTDRATDMVVSGGVNIYPAEAEAIILQHPAVSDVALFGVPDNEMGERLIGHVVLVEPNISGDDLVQFCRSRLAHYKCPKELSIVEVIPRNAMGKIQKHKLRATHSQTRKETVGIPVPEFAELCTQVTAFSDVAFLLRHPDVRVIDREADKIFRHQTLVTIDGPEHLERRRLESPLFSPARLAEYERKTLDAMLDQFFEEQRTNMDADGEVHLDLVSFGLSMLIRIGASITGIDGVDDPGAAAQLLSYMDGMATARTAYLLKVDEEEKKAIVERGIEHQNRFREEFVAPSVARRRDLIGRVVEEQDEERNLPRDLITHLLAHAEDDGQVDDLVTRESGMFLDASVRTSTRGLCNAMFELEGYFLEHPEENSRRFDPDFLASVVEETIRLHVVSPFLMRIASADITLPSGDVIHQGEQVLIFHGVANRDETIFGERPDDFNPYRNVAAPGVRRYGMSFGSGPHTCIGRRLAIGGAASDTEERTSGTITTILGRLFRAGVSLDATKPPQRNLGSYYDEFESFPVVLKSL